jgi:DNA repair protein RAD5
MFFSFLFDVTECVTPLFNERGFARCPVCRAIISRDKLFLAPAPIAPETLIDVKRDWQHSSKTRRLMEELQRIRASSDPKAKSIVFSQWTAMLDLLEIPLKKEGMNFLRLDGSLSQSQREIVLRRFAKELDQSVLLISLKAGGVGLNLVSANHVFFMDCWSDTPVHQSALRDGLTV